MGVYSTGTKKWKRPHRFISIERETAAVHTSRDRRIFRSTCIKPFKKLELDKAVRNVL